MTTTKKKIDTEKLVEENKHLRQQHINDMRLQQELKTQIAKSIAEINAAADILITGIVEACGAPVMDGEELIGKNITMPAPKDRGYKLVIDRFIQVTGLEEENMYRIGIVYPENVSL